MSKGCVFILSVSSDIGHALALSYLADGYEVVGTYRDRELVADLAQENRVQLLYCDVALPESINRMIIAYKAISKPWDIFISCVGALEPIGTFFSSDFDVWEKSVNVNSLAQLRVLSELWPYRKQGQLCHAAFFAGGGTNSPLPNYSAYAASKIFLIKMCELLDNENPDLNIFIMGPGFLKTKIHRSDNFDFSQLRGNSTSFEDIYNCINWCVAQGKKVSGGRNFSVVHDEWRSGGRQLREQLIKDENKFKLRRFRNKEE